MSKEGNGKAQGQPTEGILQRILGRANSERTQQGAFWRTHKAISDAKGRRIKRQQGRDYKGKS